ncbi:MAG TPA: polysaccharide biosynthesis tyrosine autokinase [Gemmatimonadaceae bacterium]|nr:polysaccharide biosynthesis tyrosine autokinase [Gemmatimonadaceae bacterium]HET7620695.1 polysaccharide biosynthesis tyrosine autokinase [Gemmatimonadaceae bacterium]
MSANYIPSNLPVDPSRDMNAVGFPQAWPAALGQATAEEPGIPWGRYVAALRRYKWLILAIALIGTGIGFAVSRMTVPEYQVQGTLWIADPNTDTRGPVRGEELLGAGSWADLLKSSTIMNRVVENMGLYLWPANVADSSVFAGFKPGPGFRSGTFQLQIDPTGSKYSIITAENKVLEQGAVGDSVGRSLGFLWKPSAAALGKGRTISFTVANPRSVAASLTNRIDVIPQPRSSFLKLTLDGRSPQRTASILNAVMTEFVNTAVDLKRRNLTETAKTLEDQLNASREALSTAESKLESFRTSTITLPSEQLAMTPNGVAGTTSNPVSNNYFDQKFQLEAVQRDRQALEALLSNPDRISADAFMLIPSAKNAPDLQAALKELSQREMQLRTARELYTDQHPTVQSLQASVDVMRKQTIPDILRSLISQLRKQEGALSSQVEQSSSTLKAIPARTIDQMRLIRDVQTKQGLFTMLASRTEEARLAAASATPDITILDTAVAPLNPTTSTGPQIIILALLASLGGAVGLALLLDHTDSRFRYPEQATGELGLTILGAVPTIKRVRGGEPDPEEAAQVIEAFRTIRMSITNSYAGSGPIMFTISSPGAGDGKSLVSSNLALSFAEAGYRTVLVDGDTRRGQLHAMFGANRRPGLLDYLGGDAPLDAVLRNSTHEKLTLIPCGTRRHRGPELLHSQAMLQLITDLRERFDVIIVDSPPLGAGVDPFVLGAATGNMVVVLRTGATDRKMAEAKLKLLERLPIRPLGAVLNDIRAQGVYRYYTYLYGYTTSEDDEMPRLAPQVGELTGQT